MPHFSATGHDVVLCQVCGRDVDTGQEKVVWRPDITGSNSAGNVCPTCLEAAETAKNNPRWTMLHPQMTEAHLGFLPEMLNIDDPRPAREQFNSNYVAGWSPFKGHRLNLTNNVLTYPGDPPMKPLARTQLRDEVILFYDCAWVVIRQPDDSWEIARMD